MKKYLNMMRGVAVAIALLVGAIGTASAQVDVSATYNKVGGIYQYQFSVTNNSASTLDLVSVFVPGLPFTVNNTSAPTGFDINSGILGSTGYVNFVQDLDDTTPQTFAPSTTVQFFTLDSPDIIAPAKFSAQGFGVNGGVVTFGGGVAGLTAPEPATLPLCALMLLVIGGVAARRRSLLSP